MLEEAKYYLKNNISIIPVGRDKKPLIKWAEFQKRRATTGELDQWFKDYPDMQIGLVTGDISNLTVVDIDDGTMDVSWLPDTAIVKTGSGGFHYYYNYSKGVGNSTRIKENIDIRSEGGYVIAPPSSNEKGKYTWIKKTALTNFPKNLFYKNEKIENQSASITTEYEGKNQGSRNDEMARYTGHILAKIHPSEWGSIAWGIIKEANKKNTPPLDESELRAVFGSIKAKEENNSTERWYQKKEEVKEAKIEINIKKDYGNRYTWGTGNLDNSLAILKRGNFAIVGAKRSSGKTTYTFDMACKNALLGHKVLYISLEMDEQKIKKDFARKYAGWTVQEEYHNNIPEVKQLAYEKKIKELESIEYLFFRGMRRGGGTTWNDVLSIIKEFKDIDLIFIDNLDLIDGEQGDNDIERQKKITKKIMNFTEEFQVPIILIHHHRKSGGKMDYGSDELSGSGKVADNADIIFKIERNQDAEAEFPDNCRTTIFQQKGRGYPNAIGIIYFCKGTFEDEPIDNYF